MDSQVLGGGAVSECIRCECPRCQEERALLMAILEYLRHEHMRRRDIITAEQEIAARFSRLLQPAWDASHPRVQVEVTTA